MKANSVRQELETIDPAIDQAHGWDAQTVWRERVRKGPTGAAADSTSQGWDPYLVWLSRVKKDPAPGSAS